MSGTIISELRDDALHLTFNRPERKNALSYRLLEELHDALKAAPLGGCRALVLSGGPGCFSAGADLHDLTGTTEDAAMDEHIGRVVTAIRELPVPVIARVDGPCIGGAVEIMLACDLRVAVDAAYVQVPAARLGLLYNPAAVLRMRRLLTRDALTRLLVVGERFDAPQALASGLVTHVVPEAEIGHRLEALLRQASANDATAVACTKRMVNALCSGDFEPAYWEGVRGEILASPRRRDAIARAKKGSS